MTYDELIIDRGVAKAMLDAVNAQILNLAGRTNKKYEYSNNETKHISEIQDIDKLYKMRKELKTEISNIDNIVNNRSAFTQIKNF